MKTYYTLNRGGKGGVFWIEREGRKVKNAYGLDLYVEHRGKNNWVITEAKSGLMVGEGSLRRLAVEHFEEKIEFYGLKYLQEKIEECIELYGESPLYTDEPKLLISHLEKEDAY